MNDKELQQNIIDELDFEPSVDSAHIGVAVEKGVVTLTGHVSSYAEKTAVERAARRVKGVRAIAQEIEVRYPSDKKTVMTKSPSGPSASYNGMRWCRRAQSTSPCRKAG